MSKYRLVPIYSDKYKTKYIVNYVIEKKIMFLWCIPIWVRTDYKGNNPSEMNRLLSRLNRCTK